MENSLLERHAMKKNLLFIPLFFVVLIITGCVSRPDITASNNVTISKKGVSDYVIVIPDNSKDVLRTAAQELASHLKQVTGGEFPVVSESERPKRTHAFVIGAAKAASEVFEDANFSNAKPDAIGIRFKNGDIYLNGQMPHGPLYAVYTFLEDYVGVRWWTSSESFIPNKPTLSVEAKQLDYAPALLMREAHYRDCNYDGVFASRLKLNGHFYPISDEYGKHRAIIGFCHTFYQFLPPDKYYAEHPDWYGVDASGAQGWYGHQLCLTNEEMRKEFVKVCLEKIAQFPYAGMISVSQNDWRNPCQCPACKAIEEEEGSPSGPLLRFVNAVAADIAKVYPDFYVETLAYLHTRKPPKLTKPADNVVIRLCNIECDFAHSMEDGPANSSFRNDIESWSKIAPNLFIWNYVANYRNFVMLYPNYRNIAKDLRYFVRNNTIGIFEQGDSYCSIGDFVRPRNWVIAHLCWNPDLDEKALVQEFFQGYYGAAGPYLVKYLDYLCDAFESTGLELHCFGTNCNFWLTPEILSNAWKLYHEAEEAVKDDPVLSARVRRERFSLDMTTLLAAKNLKRAERFSGVSSNVISAADLKKIFDEIKQYVEENKVYSINEGTTDYDKYWDGVAKGLFEIEQSTQKVPDYCKNLPESNWDHFTAIDFNRFGDGTQQTALVDDVNSSSGKAVFMATDHNEWFIQKQLESCYGTQTKWRFRINIRCDADANDGIAVECGLYSPSASYYGKNIMVDECKGEKYVSIITDPVQLKPNTTLWFAPVTRPLSEIRGVYIDSVTMIKEE